MMLHSHSGALRLRVDRTPILGEAAGCLACSGLLRGAAALVVGVVGWSLQLAVDARNGRRVLLVLIHGPVEDVVVLEALADEEVAEDLTEVRVIRLVVKAQTASVVEVDGELIRESAAQDFSGGGHLLLHDPVILLLLGGSL